MNRNIILAYGAFAYLAFNLVFLYAIAFLSDAVVPKTVNSGTAGPIGQALMVDIALIAFFGIVHSAMARPAFKETWTRIIPPAAERSTFVLVASLQFAILFWLWQPIPITVWNLDFPFVSWIIRAISMSGWLLVLSSSFAIDHFDLFGMRQVWLNFRGITYTHPPFIIRGLYKYIRHPLMLGFMIAFWFTPHMTVGHLVFALSMTAYIFIGMYFEERDLEKHLGDDYRFYKSRTGKIFPRFNQGS